MTKSITILPVGTKFEYKGLTYQELADADNIIPDDLVFDYFEGTDFVPEDFICSSN